MVEGNKTLQEKEEKHWKFIVSIVTAIILAGTGYLYTWNQSRSDAQYAAQLERVNQQLREYYGPLYALVEADDKSFQHFVNNTRPEVRNAYWDSNNPPNELQQKKWRTWFIEVTIPNYLKMEEIIMNHSDLLIEDDIPHPIIELTSHIAGYKTVVAAWKEGDYSKNWSFSNFPQEVRVYLRDSFSNLKLRQKILLGFTEGGPNKQIQPTPKNGAADF